MAETPWQQQFQKFLAKASVELKRTGEELKAEAQRLMVEVRDPANQQKVKDGLRDLGSWAKKTADQAAEVIDSAVKKAETTWKKSPEKGSAPAPSPSPKTPPAQVVSIPKPIIAKPGSPAAKAQKTVGKKKPSGAAKAPASGKAPAKSIGKKKSKPA